MSAVRTGLSPPKLIREQQLEAMEKRRKEEAEELEKKRKEDAEELVKKKKGEAELMARRVRNLLHIASRLIVPIYQERESAFYKYDHLLKVIFVSPSSQCAYLSFLIPE